MSFLQPFTLKELLFCESNMEQQAMAIQTRPMVHAIGGGGVRVFLGRQVWQSQTSRAWVV